MIMSNVALIQSQENTKDDDMQPRGGCGANR